MSGNDETIAAIIALARQHHETVVFAIMLEQVLGDGHAGPLPSGRRRGCRRP